LGRLALPDVEEIKMKNEREIRNYYVIGMNAQVRYLDDIDEAIKEANRVDGSVYTNRSGDLIYAAWLRVEKDKGVPCKT
jgi:hypothetical protein